ncbi:hypothetical protein TWF106_003861 [Orbilia oligospora]|uniref:Uncharacterized protein n=1 Tax=Orbilia oligospora TaxID=2813651 RepID=A0A6G1LSV4_ORBOL|nr:hypothetical protein TWF679_011040 [Orbilia oligospora]KAF3204986.1 hypothetical protein TWF191_001979 [Orbilia oligospora]KAF3224394.1 hypothetical protein TWF106_003861 [Orbilia oligospora]KAF3232869.1 hypothetical protein TWF192_002796 [Orbilia oligospora]
MPGTISQAPTAHCHHAFKIIKSDTTAVMWTCHAPMVCKQTVLPRPNTTDEGQRPNLIESLNPHDKGLCLPAFLSLYDRYA